MTNSLNIAGIAWPFQFVNGQVATSFNDRHISQAIQQIIGTSKLEYLMKPESGCNLRRRVFDPQNVAHLIIDDIREALASDGRISNINVGLNTERMSESLLFVTVEFSIAGTPSRVVLNLSRYYFGGGDVASGDGGAVTPTANAAATLLSNEV